MRWWKKLPRIPLIPFPKPAGIVLIYKADTIS